MHYKQHSIYTFIFSLCMLTTPAFALDVNITKTLSGINTAHNGKVIRIQRNQDQKNVLTGGYTKTSRQCPPFCIQPINVAANVKTVAELEVLNFIKNIVNKGTGVLIDARTKSWFEKATIPGSINIPFNTFDKDSSDLVKASALAKLGVTVKSDQTDNSESLIDQMMGLMKDDTPETSNKWDFSRAKKVLLWCNGMWCGQSPRAIRGMLALGYPADKIYYYRGGMQAWQSLGLTVIKGDE
ncbi:MAG: rhodanese-like domain-containing protein [endosymbiont of Galathealinum brachiosum]|uniref:Rhodanese-like domain-containing protein n=1 Tax=endosymbiont of Galathealinum brachiosum TaxID=2200906 RepID=A0A370DI59_9GAMM|nr:MAG: rhodanese-like domain-containing protein [endosymbiont of Galathealinum brachiosum]